MSWPHIDFDFPEMDVEGVGRVRLYSIFIAPAVAGCHK